MRDEHKPVGRIQEWLFFFFDKTDEKCDLSVNILDLNLLAWLFEGAKLLFTQEQFPTGVKGREGR